MNLAVKEQQAYITKGKIKEWRRNKGKSKKICRGLFLN
jgi:YD repeat-containing protein